jgi:DNA-binding CsgD family transcriptional regulator
MTRSTGRNHIWTNHEEAQLALLWLDGKTETEISLAMGLSQNQIHGRIGKMRKEGVYIPHRDTGKKWTPEECATLVQMWNAGASSKEIAAALNRAPNSVAVKAFKLRGTGIVGMKEKAKTPPKVISAWVVIDVVCEDFGVTVKQLASKSKRQKIVEPRHIAAALCYRLSGNSLQVVGRLLGCRNHTSILYAKRVARVKYPEAFSRVEAKVQAIIGGDYERKSIVEETHGCIPAAKRGAEGIGESSRAA